MDTRKRKLKREQLRRYRARKKAKGYKLRWVMFEGMDKLGTEKIKRKSRMLPQKKGTWLKKVPKHGSKIIGSF